MTVERLRSLSAEDRAALLVKWGPDVIDVPVEEVGG